MKFTTGFLLFLLFMPPAIAAAQDAGRIDGILFLADHNTPVSGAHVALSGTERGVVTGRNGAFTLTDVPAGTYTLVASRVGFASASRTVVVRAGAASEVVLHLAEAPLEIPEIVVERVTLTGGVRGLDRIPGAAHYLTPQALDRHSDGDVHRILSAVPGVTLQDEDGYGLRPNIGMRGSGVLRSQKITVMEDGVLAAPAPYAAPEAYYFPTAGRMQGVEVRKGSSQIKYGPHTTGGALNLISTQIPSAFDAHATAVGGPRGEGTLHLYAGDTNGRFGYLVEGYGIRSDGFKELDGGGGTGFLKRDLLVKARIATRPDARVFQALAVKVGAADETSDETYLGLTADDFAATPFRRYAASQRDEMNTDHRQVAVRHLVRPGAGVDVTTTAYYNAFARNWYKLDRVRAAEGGERVSIASLLADPAAHRDAYALLAGETSTHDAAFEVKANNREYYARGVETVAGLRFDALGAEQQIEAGVRLHADGVDRFQWVDLYRMDEGVMTQTAEGTPGTESNRLEDARAFAAFTQVTAVAGRFTLVPGLRYEHVRLSRDDYGRNDPARTGADLSSRSNTVDALIPGVGAGAALGGGVDLFAGVHRGFTPPGSVEGSAPESSIAYEGGARVRRGMLRAQGTAFFNDYSNLLGRDLAAVGGDALGRLYNGGDVHVAGVEAEVDYNAGGAADWRVSLPFSLAYTYTRGTFRTAFDSDFDAWGAVSVGDELPYLPRHQLAASAGVEGGRYGAYLKGAYASAMRTVAGSGPVDAAQSTDARLVLDLSAEYVVAPGARLFGSVRNLTDAVYVVARRPAGLRPGLPRTFLLGVKLDL